MYHCTGGEKINSNENGFNFASIIKFAVIGLICTLILGLIFFNLTQFSTFKYGYYVTTGLTVLAFPVGLLISVCIFSRYMDTKWDAIIMGVIVAVLTGFLQSPLISLVMGKMMGAWFDEYIGNQILILIIVAIFAAYVGNMYLKRKIN